MNYFEKILQKVLFLCYGKAGQGCILAMYLARG